jgi:phosphate starvation-inducible PhoH-like protein
METSVSLSFDDNSLLPILYGEQNSNIKFLEQNLAVDISSRGNYIAITGDSEKVRSASYAIERLYDQLKHGMLEIKEADIKAAIQLTREVSNLEEFKSKDTKQSQYVIKTRKKTVFPYTENQHKYLESLHQKDVIFSIGAAGTGKTYLAVATAVSLFLQKQVSKIILTRPAVEAGEKLGFLPGDIREKVDPYLRPLYDALFELLPSENVERYFATQEFQIAPLAFMRGRTLNNAFVILDEAQNATVVQMKMFLTRLGYNSKMAITGDLTQIDLPKNIQSGLIDAIERLKHLEEIAIIKFGTNDVVRHPLTAKIIDAYEQN